MMSYGILDLGQVQVQVNIDTGSGLLPVPHQTITWTNSGVLSLRPKLVKFES